jgi:hypothetical protein
MVTPPTPPPLLTPMLIKMSHELPSIYTSQFECPQKGLSHEVASNQASSAL